MLSICLTGCITYKQFITQDYICDYDFSIKENDKYFEIDKYNHDENIITYRQSDVLNNDTIYYRVFKLSDESYYTSEIDKKNKIDKSIEYHHNGFLKNIQFSYAESSTLLNKETHFDQNGNITKIIDHDKGYKICWAQAIEIVKHKRKNELAKYDAVSFILGRVDLEKFPDEKPVWSVGIDPEPDNTIGETIYHKVDGVTGKYLGKYKVTMVHD